MDNSQYKKQCGPPTGIYVNELCPKHKNLASAQGKNSNQSRLGDGTSKDGKMQYLISQWSNQCIYRCGECQKEFKSFKTLTKSHIKEHQLSKLEYVSRHGKEMHVKVYHQCSICEKKVLQNFDYITKHLKKFHPRNDIFSYYLGHHANVAIDDNLVDDLNDGKVFHTVIKANKEITNEVHFEDVNEQTLYHSWVSYKPIRGEFEICKLCQRGVMKNSTFFGRHLNKACDKNKEKLDLFQYFLIHVLPSYKSLIPKMGDMFGNPEDVTHDEIIQSNQFGLANLFSENNQISRCYNVSGFEIERNNADDFLFESNDNDLPEAVVSTSNVHLPSSSPDITDCLDEYFNKCKYECPICRAHLKSVKKFRNHVIHEHSVSEEIYKKDYPNPFPMNIMMYKCKMCGHNELHDATPIERHVQETHQLSLNDYFDNFCTN